MTTKKVAVIAVGGNSLIKDKEHKAIPDQYVAAAETISHIIDMIEQGWDVVVSHGNGPQVGFILRRAELAIHELHPVPLDYCGADTQGAIGYMFQQAAYNEFLKRGMKKQAATIITQTLVDKNDTAFQNPSKPIGSFMEESDARRHKEDEGWAVVEDAGRGWRRVVPSPIPQRIIEADVINDLIQQSYMVISVGGGGIPVIEREDGSLAGVEAVIDKDFSSAVLANSIQADLFLISTAIEKVALNFNKPNQKWLDEITVAKAKQYLAEGHFAKGSMEPKIKAIISFLEKGGKEAIITTPENIGRALAGETGTRVVP